MGKRNSVGWITKRYLTPMTVVLLAATQGVYGAADPQDTLQPIFTETISYDDNLFRLAKHVNPLLASTTGQRWDVINRAAAGLKVYYPMGRQELSADGSIGYQNYVNHDYLNNLNGFANGKWKWRLGNDFDGLMSYGYQRAIGGFTNTGFFGRDMITNNTALFDGNYWFNPSWRLNGKYIWLDSQHSAEQRKFLDVIINTGMGGIYYQSTKEKDSFLGVRYRYSSGFQPHRQVNFLTLIDNSYTENEVVADVAWKPTGKSQLQGNIGWLQRTQPEFSQRNFSGPIWRLDYLWLVTEITHIEFATYRQLRSFQDLTASYIVADGVSLNPKWSATPKITVEARLVWEQWDYQGSPITVAGAKTREDTVWAEQVVVGYKFIRNAEASLTYQATQRTSNLKNLGYEDNMVFASVSFAF